MRRLCSRVRDDLEPSPNLESRISRFRARLTVVVPHHNRMDGMPNMPVLIAFLPLKTLTCYQTCRRTILLRTGSPGYRLTRGKSAVCLAADGLAQIVKATTENGRKNMAQAIMDPEQVRRFADELKRFNADLQDKIASLQARFAALGDTWQDQEHAKFAEEFKQIMKALKKFVEISNQQTPYLLRKAQRIEEYLNQR